MLPTTSSSERVSQRSCRSASTPARSPPRTHMYMRILQGPFPYRAAIDQRAFVLFFFSPFGWRQVMSGGAANAFCCVRPPGHHAEPHKAMGFCFFNNAPIGALHAKVRRQVPTRDRDHTHLTGREDTQQSASSVCHTTVFSGFPRLVQPTGWNTTGAGRGRLVETWLPFDPNSDGRVWAKLGAPCASLLFVHLRGTPSSRVINLKLDCLR